MVGLQLCFLTCIFRLYQDVGYFCPSCHQKVARFPYRGKAAEAILPGRGTRVYPPARPVTDRKGKQQAAS
ncbi:hypothetical protein PG985_002006 [Apiospora marii]|uniref:LITAF domain-containing protein n=1 Tax=Apiospora marii TaxID=335849 RepID=A0ABR1RYB4_9PEZI